MRALMLVLVLAACGVEELEPVDVPPTSTTPPPCAWRQYRVRTNLYEYEQVVDDGTGPLGTGWRRTWTAPPPAFEELDGATFTDRWSNVGTVLLDRTSTTGCAWSPELLESSDPGRVRIDP